MSDDEGLEAIAEFRGYDSAEFLKRDLFINSQLSIYEQAYYAFTYGLMEPEEWARFENGACNNFQRVNSMQADRGEFRLRLTDGFLAHLSEAC